MITLAAMLATDKDALICDLAETYGILDMEALPVDKLAVLSFGLRDNSRIKLKMSGMGTSFDRLMLAGCFDKLSWLQWSRSKAAEDGTPPPKSIYGMLAGIPEPRGETEAYDTPEEYEAAREKIIKEAQYVN